MSFTKDFFSKLRRDDGGSLPLFTSPPSRPVDEFDLAELSPRPDEALLANHYSDTVPNDGMSNVMRNRGNSIHAQNKGSNAKMTASVSFRDLPYSPGGNGDRFYDDKLGNRRYDYNTREERPRIPILGIWRPSFLHEPHDPHAASAEPQQSFFESMLFNPRPTLTERTPSTRVDQSFKIIERRERQMQQELQQLLDAQDYALEKHLANTSPEDDVSRRSKSPAFDTPSNHIVPVRQPKKRHLSKKEARLGILRCMSQLSDLKNEEEAYIATALAERKAALSRLRSLSSKRNSVLAEMKAIETEHGEPHKNEVRKMEQRHHEVCGNIVQLEEKLRELKRIKTRLESRIAEAKSTRDSELSGYRGALYECDRRIKDMMDYPDVAVLEIEGLMARDTELKTLVGQHISGFEFLSLRPERRTPPMAKDWWDGEVQVLEMRKTSVDKERGALDEGTQLWQDVLDRLEEHDRHLKLTFDNLSRYSGQQTSDFDVLAKALIKQYELCKETTKELEDLHDYTAAKGWKLLVTALSAEINYFHGLKKQLGDTLQVVGLVDGTTTPPFKASSGGRSIDDLLGVHDTKDLEDHLTGSVIRRWDRPSELRRISPNDDNGEPLGVRQESHLESDDEHNEVPHEFLSMHSPSPRSRNKGKGKDLAVAEGTDGEEGRSELEHRRDEVDEEEEKHHALSRESSANEVPPDLLAESHHAFD